MAQSLNNLPIGAKIKLGKYSVNGEVAEQIIWMVVAKNHSSTPAYPTNAITLITEKIIDLRAFDAAEPNNTDSNRKSSGNNDYSVSNIDQWLNEDKVAWYVARHSADQSPNGTYTLQGTAYDARPGFLSNFTSNEKNAILNTTIRVAKYSYTTEDITRKVFLPSVTEIGLTVSEIIDGSMWAYFESNGVRRTSLTPQCYRNTLSQSKPSGETAYWQYWVRSASYSTTQSVFYVSQDGGYGTMAAFMGGFGVRPAINLSSALSISDTMDGDGCYNIIWNAAPPRPTILNVPTIYGGKTNLISWSNVTDPDGETVIYQLECTYDSGNTYTPIYSGATASYAHLVPLGTTSIGYRVKATDPSGESSEYTTSNTITVINNNAPVVSGADSNLGVKSSGFTGTYTITDANNDAVTVSEAIDGVQIRSLVATLGQEITYGITENTWLALPNGSHTLTISATDGIDTTVRTYTFTKLVESFKIQNSTPWVASSMPTRIMLVVTRNIPPTSIFKVEVCNNGYDTSPTWENATDAVTNGLVHVFSNTTKTATDWGVLVRVTVERNGATGACYISAIGGNFE